jgi:hypothetical protein
VDRQGIQILFGKERHCYGYEYGKKKDLSFLPYDAWEGTGICKGSVRYELGGSFGAECERV